jgi:hypothetical protein
VGYLSLILAALGLGAIAITGLGKYLALGLGLFAFACGLVGYREAQSQARKRLSGAAGMALGTVAFLLGGTKVGLTLLAVSRLQHLLGP